MCGYRSRCAERGPGGRQDAVCHRQAHPPALLEALIGGKLLGEYALKTTEAASPRWAMRSANTPATPPRCCADPEWYRDRRRDPDDCTDPFCRLRVPEITEQWAAARAAAIAHHRRDPRTMLAHVELRAVAEPVLIPALAPELSEPKD